MIHENRSCGELAHAGREFFELAFAKNGSVSERASLLADALDHRQTERLCEPRELIERGAVLGVVHARQLDADHHAAGLLGTHGLRG